MDEAEPRPVDAVGQPSDQPTGAIETHLSRLFLTPDRVYKQLKPVTTSFVDLAGLDDRLHATDREYELNRRIAPDVYLGTADVEEAGKVVDRFIVMRRLPADRQLDRLVGDPAFADRIREVAKLLAVIHSAKPPERGQAAAGATLDALRANWADSFAVMEPLVGPVIDEDRFRRSQLLVERYLAGRSQLFEDRIAQGWVRDGHGDLRAEHIFCLDDGPRLIDCLAFRDDLRIGDVLADIAFLAMDLHRLAGPAAAWSLIHHYDEFSAERHPSTLAHHYAAYRANVRAKVAAVRFGQGVTDAAAEAATYHELAHQHLLVGQTRLVLVGGGAGVGKSTVAAGVADSLGAIWLRADEIRKNMAGIPADQHAWAEPDQGIYRPEFSDLVYREMLREAEVLLARGESVVLDATWSSQERRTWATDLADRSSSVLTELECRVPLAVARERIARRLASLDQPSDATPEVANHIAASFDPWTTATAVDTNVAVRASVAQACRSVLSGPESGTDSEERPGTDRGTSDPQPRLDQLVLSVDTVEFFLTRIAAWEHRLAARPWPGPTGRPI